MPRNAAGTYTLPLPPVVTDTTITSNFENSTDSDIASEITNSLDRNGRGGMLAPFKIFDGTLAAPGLAFTLEPGSGLYRIGAGDWAAAVTGVRVMEFTVGGVTIPVGINGSFGGALFVNSNAAPGDYVQIIGQAAGANAVTIGAGGVDANISITLAPKGTGNLVSDAAFFLFNAGQDATICNATADGADTLGLAISGGGLAATNRGAVLSLFGNEQAALPGCMALSTGAVAGATIRMYTGGAEQVRVEYAPTATSYLLLIGGTTGQRTRVLVDGGAGIIDLAISAKGTGNLNLMSNNGTDLQVQISAVPGANRYIVMQGGNNSRPFIGPNTGELQINALSVSNGFRTDTQNIFARFENGFLNPPAGASGLGIEVGLSGGVGVIQAYDRTLVAYKTLQFVGDQINILTQGAQRGLWNSSGFMKMASDNLYNSVGGTYHEINSPFADTILSLRNNHPGVDAGFGLAIQILNGSNTVGNAGRNFVSCVLYTAEKFTVMTQGGIRNFSANNVNISTGELKQNIEPLTPVTTAQLWNSHRDVEWCAFKYREQWHDDPNFGYLAEDIALKFADVAPWLVDEQEVGPKGYEVKRKVVYYDDLHNVGHAVLSECQRRIEALELAISDYVKQ
jgi:hypothetical protein